MPKGDKIQRQANENIYVKPLMEEQVKVQGKRKKKTKRVPELNQKKHVKPIVHVVPEPEPTITSRFKYVHFQKASPILKRLRLTNSSTAESEEQSLTVTEFDNMDEKVLTYELVVSVLKYSCIIEEMLDLAKFFVQFPNHQEDSMEDIILLTYDLLDRNFQVQQVDVELSLKLQNIQINLISIIPNLKLSKQALLEVYGMESLENFLPQSVRNQKIDPEGNSLFAWINTMKTDTETIIQNLSELGLRRVDSENTLRAVVEGFYIDPTYTDLVRFHQGQQDFIYENPLVLNGSLIIEDKMACIQIYSLVKSLYFKELMHRGRRRLDGSYELSPLSEYLIKTPYGNPIQILLEDWYHGIIEDPETYAAVGNSVIVTHTGSSARSIAHLGVLLQNSVPKWLIRQSEMQPNQGDLLKSIESKFTKRPALNVIAFGAPAQKLTEITKFLKEKIGLKNVKVYAEDFLSIQPKDKRVRGSIAILVNPPCSGTALRDPVYHICREGGDEETLTQFTQYVQNYYHSFKSSDPAQIQIYQSNQGKYLNHALGFGQARLVMYTTCSELKSENWDLVSSVVSQLRQENEENKLQFFTKMLKKKNSKSFNETIYEFVDMSQILHTYPKESFNGPFFEMRRNIDLNGGFIGLVRKKEKVIQISRNPTPGTHSGINMPSSSDSNDIQSILKNSNQRFTQLELSHFLEGERLGSESQSAQSDMILSIPRALELAQKFNLSITSAYKFNDPGKKKFSANTNKKIIERLQIPTFSTLAKQNEKWRPNTPVTPSSRPSSSSTVERDRPKSRRDSEFVDQNHHQDHIPFIHPRHNKNSTDQRKLQASRSKTPTSLN